METLKIFVASSSELKEDRDEFRAFLSTLNDRGHTKGVYFEMVQWEHFMDAISETRLQDEYNKKIKDAQIVLCLFYTKAGKYTQEEFDTALEQFKETGAPLIYTYFKDGAPKPDPENPRSMDLANFKKRLSELGHFYTSYSNIDNLKNKFREQLDILEDKGFITYQEEVKTQTQEAVTNYFNVKNAIIDSTINTGGGDVHVGDKIENKAEVTGSNNVVIQGASESSITVNVNGDVQEVERNQEVIIAMLKELKLSSFTSGSKNYDVESVTAADFGYIVDQAGRERTLPIELAENLVGEGVGWLQSLQQEIKSKHKIRVGSKEMEIIQNYGWLVETFLQKMLTPAGSKMNLRRLSFMAEAWQGSLRYLCYIQMAQILQMDTKPELKIITDFLKMEGDGYLDFNYPSLLINTTDQIGTDGFMPEIKDFVDELTDKDSALFATALFLEDQRSLLLENKIQEDENLPVLLDEYLTALASWLRRVSFLAKYRMVSIKDINLDYRLGTTKTFVHLFGELHGFYSESGSGQKDYDIIEVEEAFTYSKSILLFKGSNVDYGLDQIDDQNAYLSLSPLIIDQSVYADNTQTPEIYYYAGYEKDRRCFKYALFKNELIVGDEKKASSNKVMEVKSQNTNQPKLNPLYNQLEDIFKPFKI